MDHGGQRDSRVMSEVPSDEDHQTSTNSNTNVDSAEVLNQSRRDLLKNEQPNEEGGDKLLKNISFSVKVQQDGDKEKVNSEGDREEDGEEDTDEVMKVGEEEELSTQKHLPMTDSPHPDTEPTCSTRTTPSHGEQKNSTRLSVSTCSPVSPPGHVLLRALEKLAQREEDFHFPYYLHQIAEAFVLQKDYQLALCCIHLEALYHHRLLDNLRTVRQQWESLCRTTSSDLELQLLDSLRHICQTHTRPSSNDAVCLWTLDCLRPGGGGGASCSTASVADTSLGLTEVSDQQTGCPESYRQELTDEKARVREAGAEGGPIMSFKDSCLDQSTAEYMDQSELEKHCGGLSPRGKAEEEANLHVTLETVQLEDGEQRQETLAEEQQETLAEERQETLAEERPETLAEEQHESTQEPQLSNETHMNQISECEEVGEEEEEFEDEAADLMKGASLLDDMAKRITVEEVSHASGLVSILKKRSVCVDTPAEPQRLDRLTAKRRVRFKVSDDDDQEVGGGDSCLLLFLLCLVTVVISVGGTALYCALGDTHSSVCQDFSRNADFYMGHIQHRLAHLQQWFGSG